MKRLMIFLLALAPYMIQAQSAIAKIKYEQAEEAFTKSDFTTTLSKLNEAEKLLGASNPKIMYLRLMASKGIVATGTYDYEFIAAARKDAQTYLKENGEVEGIEEKYRDVYTFYETLEKLPQTKKAYEAHLAAIQQKQEDARREEAARLRKEGEMMNKVVDSLSNLIGFKPGLTEEQFLQLFPKAGRKMNRSVIGNSISYFRSWDTVSDGPYGYVVENGIVINCKYTFTPSLGTKRNIDYYTNLKSWVYAKCPAGSVIENPGVANNIGNEKISTTHSARLFRNAASGATCIEVTIRPVP